MAWYQARKHLLDFVNHLDIEYGVYVETDCVNWVKRFGPNLRPLALSESPKETFKKIAVTNTVEDKNTIKKEIVQEVKEEDIQETEDVKEEVAKLTKGTKPPVTRRKIKPALTD